MIPPEIMEWAVGTHLGDHRDIETILLRGHLMLEVFLNTAICQCVASPKHVERLNLSFARKLVLLQSVAPADFFDPEALPHLIADVNRLRNSLAHRWDFSPHREELHAWAKRVLDAFPETRVTRHTIRIETIAAFSTLAHCLMKNINKTEGINGAIRDKT